MDTHVIMMRVQGPERMLESIEDFIEHAIHYEYKGRVTVVDS